VLIVKAHFLFQALWRKLPWGYFYAVQHGHICYRKVCGRSYCKDYLDYICVNPLGERIKCSYLTSGFPNFLEQHGMRRIRFHDLRHSCASLLLANGVPMKQIQEWLGHSDFSTTANVYAHLDYHSKITSAEAILTGLKMQPEA
jgi:integrase